MAVKLSDYELGWLVGLLEGEGHFRYQGTQHIVMASTDEDVMLTCVALFTKLTGKNFNLSIDKGNTKKDLYKTTVCGESARIILRLIVPYMHHRRRGRIWQILNGHKEKRKLTLAEAGIDIHSLLLTKV